MIISELTYLETVSELSTIVGGTRNANSQNNKIKQRLRQSATAGSSAVGAGAISGLAVAVNVGVNFAQIRDNNQGILDLSE